MCLTGHGIIQSGGALARSQGRRRQLGTQLPSGLRSRRALLRLWALPAIGALVLVAAGCSSRSRIHPDLQVDESAVQRAIERGLMTVKSGKDPYGIFRYSTKQVNVRLSADVIVSEVTCCWPEQEIAFAVAQLGDTSDVAVRRAVGEARRRVEQEMKFWAVIQLSKSRELGSVEFLMRSNLGNEYPPLVIETPVLLRDVTPLGGGGGMASLLAYSVRFPLQGGPGYPPLSPAVHTLQFVVREGASEVAVDFPIPRLKYR